MQSSRTRAPAGHIFPIELAPGGLQELARRLAEPRPPGAETPLGVCVYDSRILRDAVAQATAARAAGTEVDPAARVACILGAVHSGLPWSFLDHRVRLPLGPQLVPMLEALWAAEGPRFEPDPPFLAAMLRRGQGRELLEWLWAAGWFPPFLEAEAALDLLRLAFVASPDCVPLLYAAQEDRAAAHGLIRDWLHTSLAGVSAELKLWAFDPCRPWWQSRSAHWHRLVRAYPGMRAQSVPGWGAKCIEARRDPPPELPLLTKYARNLRPEAEFRAACRRGDAAGALRAFGAGRFCGWEGLLDAFRHGRAGVVRELVDLVGRNAQWRMPLVARLPGKPRFLTLVTADDTSVRTLGAMYVLAAGSGQPALLAEVLRTSPPRRVFTARECARTFTECARARGPWAGAGPDPLVAWLVQHPGPKPALLQLLVASACAAGDLPRAERQARAARAAGVQGPLVDLGDDFRMACYRRADDVVEWMCLESGATVPVIFLALCAAGRADLAGWLAPRRGKNLLLGVQHLALLPPGDFVLEGWLWGAFRASLADAIPPEHAAAARQLAQSALNRSCQAGALARARRFAAHFHARTGTPLRSPPDALLLGDPGAMAAFRWQARHAGAAGRAAPLLAMGEAREASLRAAGGRPGDAAAFVEACARGDLRAMGRAYGRALPLAAALRAACKWNQPRAVAWLLARETFLVSGARLPALAAAARHGHRELFWRLHRAGGVFEPAEALRAALRAGALGLAAEVRAGSPAGAPVDQPALDEACLRGGAEAARWALAARGAPLAPEAAALQACRGIIGEGSVAMFKATRPPDWKNRVANLLLVATCAYNPHAPAAATRGELIAQLAAAAGDRALAGKIARVLRLAANHSEARWGWLAAVARAAFSAGMLLRNEAQAAAQAAPDRRQRRRRA